jgi:hypothetical protein
MSGVPEHVADPAGGAHRSVSPAKSWLIAKVVLPVPSGAVIPGGPGGSAPVPPLVELLVGVEEPVEVVVVVVEPAPPGPPVVPAAPDTTLDPQPGAAAASSAAAAMQAISQWKRRMVRVFLDVSRRRRRG